MTRAVERHEILRTSFAWSGTSTPRQVIHEKRGISLKRVNLSDFTDQARQEMSEELLRQATPQGLNSGQDSLLQAVLVQLGARRYRLILTLPALCADSASLDLLMSEIGRLYESTNEDLAAPSQYTDLTVPNDRAFEGSKPEASLYWRQQARQAPGLGHFPFEWSQRRSGEFRPLALNRSFSSHLAMRLRALAQENNTDLRTVLLAGWRILLQRLEGKHLKGKPSLSLGVRFRSRDQHKAQRTLGLLHRYLPMPKPQAVDFSDALQETRQLLRQHALHQQAFDWLDAYPEAETSFWPAGFSFDTWPQIASYANLSFEMEEKYSCTERFTVKLALVERPDQVTWQLAYDADRIRTDDAQRLAEEFETLLCSALDAPQAAIANLSMVGPCERLQLQVELNHRSGEAPDWRSIPEWIAEQARNRPDSVAVVYRDASLSYGELLRRSNQLADRLRRAGVGPEIAVAIFLERSLEVVISLLAVLQTGGYFIPVDTALPWRRLRQLLRISRANLVLTRRQLATAMLQPGAGVLCIDEDWEFDFPRPVVRAVDPLPNHLAYCLFTSSATGIPRNIGIEHQQLSTFVQGWSSQVPAHPMRWATTTSFATDQGYTALFSALCSGGELHILPREHAALGFTLGDECRRRRLEAAKLTPTHIRMLLDEEDPQVLPQKLLISSGESCDWALIHRVRQLQPNCQIFNHYGPAESTIASLSHRILGRDPRCASAPIGRPLPGCRVYVADKCLHPVAKWTSGEILLGGSIGRGYGNDPRATAERFIPDPFSEEHGGRLFRTGDLALHVQDGSLEFLGRIDHQIKIAGRRAEPGEIETALALHPNVQAAAVLLQGRAEHAQLIAYVTPVKKVHLRPSQLRSFLSERLPDYMIPVSFVVLRSLPITENGRIDRRALPRPFDHPMAEPPAQHLASSG